MLAIPTAPMARPATSDRESLPQMCIAAPSTAHVSGDLAPRLTHILRP